VEGMRNIRSGAYRTICHTCANITPIVMLSEAKHPPGGRWLFGVMCNHALGRIPPFGRNDNVAGVAILPQWRACETSAREPGD